VSRLQIILGPPGTGKTTRLLELLSDYLKTGSPARVAFVSFSRRAVKEVAERVGLEAEAFPHFRTIHSTAYHMLELERDDVFQPKHWRQFSEVVGLPFTAAGHEEPLWDGTIGDKCLALYSLARSRGTDLPTEWRRAMLPDLALPTVTYVVGQYERFKEVNVLWDFHDMVTKAEGRLPVDVLFVDEAQDTSHAQWSFLRRVVTDVPRVVLAGDDDQEVYAWSGADGAALRRFEGERVVLPQSYRLPRVVKELADRISARIKRRVPKEFRSTDKPGTVDWRAELNTLDLRGEGTWLLLARSNYQLERYRDLARSQGVVYTLENGEWSWTLPAVRAAVTYEKLRKGSEVPRAEAKAMWPYMGRAGAVPKLPPDVVWSHLFNESALEANWMVGLPAISAHDREYIRALRAIGESTSKPGRVRIGTVHSVKGAEADHVVLNTDISQRVAHGARIDQDAEHRVQYVGVTRAKVGLHLLLPTTPTHWIF
jgi:DNA helicase-2/ATP-dependent DNA helicase PcrA